MNRRNNLDLLRLLAATGVMALHIADLSAQPTLAWLRWLDARAALATFFVISGHLVFMSCEQSPTLRNYVERRLRRILPAYMGVVLTCALAGVIISRLPATQYFGAAWWRYLLANLSFLNFLAPALPGVFTDNPYPGAPVNGALWTIKVELMFYACVPALVWAVRRWGHHRVLGLCFILGCLWWAGCAALAAHTGRAGWNEAAKQLPGQLKFFMPGAWAWYERDRLRRLGPWLGGAGAAVFLASSMAGPDQVIWAAVAYPIGLTALVSWFAYNLRHLGHATRYGDLSYGVYIVHFPVIQTLVQLGLYRASPTLAVGVTVLVVAGLARLSWRYVESPWLIRPSTACAPALKPPPAEREGPSMEN